MKSKTAFSAIKLILIFAVFINVFGQSGTSRRGVGASFGARGMTGQDGLDGQLGGQLGGLSRTANMASSAASLMPPDIVLPSDNSIDPHEYMIGSGDVFFVTVVETPSMRFTAAVDQAGRAFIQNVGLVEIGKITYAEAKEIIAERVASILRNPSEIYVTLIQTKNATVSFTGRIRYPGSYELPGTMRLLDAILAANDGDLPPPNEADLRQVVYHSGDTIAIYDIYAYLYQGDNTQNPYIYPGDRIRINPTISGVLINGAIKIPASGFYPIKEGETLGEFLTMFTMDNTADMDKIIVYQTSDNKKITLDASGMDYVLRDLDAITIPVKQNLPGIFTVHISGEIGSPGHYPIIENNTSARQLIDMAGGPKETANMSQAVVIRPIRSLPDRFSVSAEHVSTVRPERGASIIMASASQDYTIIKLILYNADRIILEPGDRIVIPKTDTFVYISGAVKNPGAYPFMQGRDIRYYVTQAGGLSSNADKSNIQVFMTYGDLVQSVETQCVESGGVIVVPTSTQYRLLTQVVLPLVSAVMMTASVVITIFGMSR
jgi:protein involved in polysaccharide export with SLBB domain